MNAMGPGFVIDGPLPIRPKYGLLDVAQIPTPSLDQHWMMGGSVDAYPPGIPEAWVPCQDEGSTVTVKESGEPFPEATFGPVTLYLPVTCTAAQSATRDQEFYDRAVRAFEATESWRVEYTLSQGAPVAAWNPYLSDTSMVKLNANTPMSPMQGLALLEQAIRELTGKEGVIHADPATVTAWIGAMLVEPDGPILRTSLNTPVATGGGYVGALPHGAGALTVAQGWAFASGPVVVYRDVLDPDKPTMSENLDRTDNEYTVRVERHYLPVWDRALQVGVLIDRTLTP
jgi:hypothetical protein